MACSMSMPQQASGHATATGERVLYHFFNAASAAVGQSLQKLFGSTAVTQRSPGVEPLPVLLLLDNQYVGSSL